MSRWALPASWAWATTAQIAKIVAGGTPSTKRLDFFSESEGIPWITPADLSGFHEKYISRGKRNLTTLGIKNSSAQILPQGAILFSSRAPIGYCVIANNAIATNQGFKNLIVKNGISIDYVWIYFSSAKDYVESVASGTTFKEISASKMQEIEIPIPPLNEQHRIVAKIEALQAHSTKAQKALEEAQRLLEKFRYSVLAAAFRGDLTARWREEHPDAEPACEFLQRIRQERRKRWEEVEFANYATKGKTPLIGWKKRYPEPMAVNTEGLPDLPNGWCWASLDELGFWFGGGTPDTKNVSFWENGTIPWYSPKDFRGIELHTSIDQITHQATLKTSAKLIHGEAILFVVRSGILRRMLPISICKNKLFTTNQDIKSLSIVDCLDGYFVLIFLLSQSENIRSACQKSGTTVESLEFASLQSYPFPLPPAAEQKEIEKLLRSGFACFEGLTESYKLMSSHIKHLNQAILAKAFKGDLVTQDPLDEPASVLLERIAAEAAVLSASDAKPKQDRRGRKSKPADAPPMVFPAQGREQRLLRLMEYIISAYPGLSTTVVEERAKLATYPAVCARLLSSCASTFRKALRESGEGWKFSKADVVRFGRLWESLEANYGIRISSEGLCTMREGRKPEPWPSMNTLLPFFNKAYTIFTTERHKHQDIQADLDSIGVMQKIA